MKKKLLIGVASISLLNVGTTLVAPKRNIIHAAKRNYKRYKTSTFSGTVTLKKKKSKTISLYNNSLNKITSHFKNRTSVSVSSIKKINGKVIAYQYKNNQWIKSRDIERVNRTTTAKLAPRFTSSTGSFTVAYNDAYLMNKNGKKINTINKGQKVKVLGVGNINNSRVWQLNNGSFIYAKYLGKINESLSITKHTTSTNKNSEVISNANDETLDSNIIEQLKNQNIALLKKYSLVKGLSGKQREVAEKILMDQLGLSLVGTSKFENTMNNMTQNANKINNWIH